MLSKGFKPPGNSKVNRYHGSLPGLLLFCGFIILTGGCSSLSHHPSEGAVNNYDGDIESYAEYVFRRQNLISSRIILLTVEPTNEEEYEWLTKAEEKILEACAPLNQIAILKAENHFINPALKYKAYDSLEECESRTRDAELLLKDL